MTARLGARKPPAQIIKEELSSLRWDDAAHAEQMDTLCTAALSFAPSTTTAWALSAEEALRLLSPNVSSGAARLYGLQVCCL